MKVCIVCRYLYGFVHTGRESWCSGNTAAPGAMLQMDFPCLGGTINKQWQCGHRSGSNFLHMEKENCGKIGTVPKLDLFYFDTSCRQTNPKTSVIHPTPWMDAGIVVVLLLVSVGQPPRKPGRSSLDHSLRPAMAGNGQRMCQKLLFLLMLVLLLLMDDGSTISKMVKCTSIHKSHVKGQTGSRSKGRLFPSKKFYPIWGSNSLVFFFS